MMNNGLKYPTDILVMISEGIDQLITIDELLRGVIRKLYRAAREKTNVPLTLDAAHGLAAVKAGDPVLIATGWPDRPGISTQIGENDGPVGAAVLARAIHRACGAVPNYRTPDRDEDRSVRGEDTTEHVAKIDRSEIDGVSGYVGKSVDGLPKEIHASIVNILAAMVRKGIKRLDS